MKVRSLVLFGLALGFNYAYSVPEASGFFLRGGNNSAAVVDEKIYSKNPEANTLYIQAQEYLSKGDPRRGGSIENAQKALRLFHEAAQKDPQFALAYIGQSSALELSSFSVSGAAIPAKLYRRQEAFALKAAEIDDNLPQAHAQLAQIYYENEYDWAKAEKELKRVIELTPKAVVAHTRYGLFLGIMGRFEEAEAQSRLAQTLDEKSAVPHRSLLRILYFQHKDDEALAEGMEALKLDKADIPTHFFMGLVYAHQGQYDKAIEEEKIAVTLGDAGSLAALAYAYAVAGNKAGVNETLQRFFNHPAHNIVNYRLAAVYAALGDKDRAMDLIEKDYRQRSNWVNWIKVDPAMDSLRQERRFKALMHKMNLKQ